MNKRQIVTLFDTRNKPQNVRPRFTAILQKVKNKIQADSKLVKLYEFNVGLEKQLGSDLNIVN